MNDKSIFNDFLFKRNAQIFVKKGKILLILGNFNIHSIEEENFSNIKFLFLLPNMNSVLQPLDAGIIESFKCKYRTIMTRWCLENPGNDIFNPILSLIDAIIFLRKGGWKFRRK